MLDSPFCSLFCTTVSLLLSGTPYLKLDVDFEKYWEGPCYLTPNNHPILGFLPPSQSLSQCVNGNFEGRSCTLTQYVS